MPVTKVGSGSCPRVPSNVTARSVARRAVARTLRPAMRLPSQSSVGIRSTAAAMRTGIGDVAARQVDDVGAQPPQLKERLRHRCRQPERVEERRDRQVDGPQGPQPEPRQRQARVRDEVALEAAMTADPLDGDVSACRGQASDDGQGRVDVAAGATGCHGDPHPSGSLGTSRARWREGYPRPRG